MSLRVLSRARFRRRPRVAPSPDVTTSPLGRSTHQSSATTARPWWLAPRDRAPCARSAPMRVTPAVQRKHHRPVPYRLIKVSSRFHMSVCLFWVWLRFSAGGQFKRALLRLKLCFREYCFDTEKHWYFTSTTSATKPALLAASQPHTQHSVNEGLHPEWVPYWLGGHWRVGIQALGYAFKIIGVLIGR